MKSPRSILLPMVPKALLVAVTSLSLPLAFTLTGCSGHDEAALAANPQADTEEASRARPAEAAAATEALPPSAPSSGGACDATSPRPAPVSVSVFPSAGEAPYRDLIASATKSLRVFGYMMGKGGVLDDLVLKAQAGVSVRVILDGETQRNVNERYRATLEAAGAEVHYSDPAFRYMHAKTIVADGARALVSTGNYGRSFMLKERNYAARTDDAKDVADLVQLFDADWSGASPGLSCTRLVVSPINSRNRLVDLLKGAKSEIMIESMQLADREVRAALVARHRAGVRVRAVVASPSWIDTNTSAAAALGAEGIEVRYLTAPAVHAKAIVVDGSWAYLGSENLSATSLDRNREIGVFVDAASLGPIATTWEADWLAATPF